MGSWVPYKSEQGRYVRKTAFWILLFLGGYGCQRLYTTLLVHYPDSWVTQGWMEEDLPVFGAPLNGSLVISLGLFLIFGSVLYWFLNQPKSADLMIETEGELKKVTWPTFPEALSSSIVVIATVLILVLYIFVADRGLGLVVERLFF